MVSYTTREFDAMHRIPQGFQRESDALGFQRESDALH